MIEEVKSELHPADPRMAELARESEQLTEEMAAKAKMESELQRVAEQESKH